jgi:hypothetical protein
VNRRDTSKFAPPKENLAAATISLSDEELDRAAASGHRLRDSGSK